MRKPSQMGCSKYEFNPEQFDIDVMNKQIEYTNKRNEIKETLSNLLVNDPVKMDETFSIMLDVLRDFKQQYNL